MPDGRERQIATPHPATDVNFTMRPAYCAGFLLYKNDNDVME